jgi:hypothetical protein
MNAKQRRVHLRRVLGIERRYLRRGEPVPPAIMLGAGMYRGDFVRREPVQHFEIECLDPTFTVQTFSDTPIRFDKAAV